MGKKFFDGIFDQIDKKIEDACSSIEKCKELYADDAAQVLKERCGVSKNFAWLAEYLIFHKIKKALEEKYGELTPTDKTKYTKKFCSGGVVLVHAVGLGELVDKKITEQPDVAIVKDKMLKAIFEIKATSTSAGALEKESTRLFNVVEKLKQKEKPLIFRVIFHELNKPEIKALEDFCKKYEAAYLVIPGKDSKENYCSLEEAIKIIKDRV